MDEPSLSEASPTTDALPANVGPLYDFDPPPEMKWWVEGLVPDKHLTMLVGDGGIGKSYLALHLGLCIAAGRPFLEQEVEQGRVLFLDHELHLHEQQRRVQQVAAGMNLKVDGPELYGNIFHYAPEDVLGSKGHKTETQRRIDELDIDFIILDSLTKGAKGDMTSQEDFNEIAHEISRWPTTLAIDHVSHSTAKSNPSSARAFGTVFKRNTARSSIALCENEFGNKELHHEKSNFSVEGSEVHYSMSFDEGCIRFEVVEEKNADRKTDESMGTYEVTLEAINEIYEKTDDPVSAEQVSEWRTKKDAVSKISDGTADNHIRKLADRNQVRRVGRDAVPTYDV
ncbi:RecA-family ATPase [Salinibacter ruber]|uniref:AAA family ATPase n=1 Tax=Salinibacter ruber TaxID=146919 RepID=UPI00161E1F46|nr:AAA family ATPase [Salinibacter ruber]MBB4060258.1 RecA-family ATPase [Salinibacter ruber]MCS3936107.1 RecA-family ATPase [Salinibacter ruber]MCS4043406.1 RecA-family ATPase [Salinibacter ruber]